MNEYNLYRLKLYNVDCVRELVQDILQRFVETSSTTSWMTNETILFAYFTKEEILVLKLALPANTEYEICSNQRKFVS